MCSICHISPCLARCPNAEEPKAVYKCVFCHEGIVDGEDYYDIYGEKVCEKCVEECKRTAETEDDYEEYGDDEEDDEDF